jgi:predicted TIM-barrel fold metal-dependent hydrolase
MDIVDAQLHMEQGPIEITLASMDAIGIRSVMLEEFWYWIKSPNPIFNHPGFELSNGSWRASYPGAELASLKYPDRFSFFVRIDRRDPEIESVMRVIASSPYAKAFRFLATRTPEEAEIFMAGGYDKAFEIAQDIGMPVCLAIPGYVEYLPRYLKKFPRVNFVVDHWGLATKYNTTGRSIADSSRVLSPNYMGEVLKLGEHLNVSIKISHAHMFFDATEFPYDPIRPHLRAAIQAFGADRVVWSSDCTVLRPAISWANLVHYIRDDPEFSRREKEKILGRNARRIFNWPLSIP